MELCESILSVWINKINVRYELDDLPAVQQQPSIMVVITADVLLHITASDFSLNK
jgi:hypothetical protein